MYTFEYNPQSQQLPPSSTGLWHRERMNSGSESENEDKVHSDKKQNPLFREPNPTTDETDDPSSSQDDDDQASPLIRKYSSTSSTSVSEEEESFRML